ncbi:MAG: OsmC family protein [Enterococcus sp.]
MEKITLIQGEHGMELPRTTENWVLLREYGYSPVQSLVAAAGACGAYVYQDVLKNSKIPVTFHGVELAYTRDEEQTSHPVKELNIHFKVSVAEELQGRAERSVRLVSKYCPVIQSLSANIQIHETVEFI